MIEGIGRRDASEQIVHAAATEHLDSESGFESFRAVGLDGTWEPS